MKFTLVCLAALFAVALAAPRPDGDAQILKLVSDVGVDEYKFAYETSDGIKAEEDGHLTNPGAENEAIAVKGYFSFTAPDGQTYTVNYIADENGFQPQGAHLPAAPEV